MRDPELRTSTHESGRGRPLWLRVLGLVVLGGFLLFVISLPGLADENQSGPSTGVYVALAAVLVAVTLRAYVIIRRDVSKRRALLVALAVVPGCYCAAVAIFFFIAYASS